jgi:hypothetical protein
MMCFCCNDLFLLQQFGFVGALPAESSARM